MAVVIRTQVDPLGYGLEFMVRLFTLSALKSCLLNA